MSILSSLVPGLVHGVERGVQQEIDGARVFVYAVEKGDTQLLSDIVDVLKKQISEGADEVTGIVKGNIVGQLLQGGDPFAGSRKMLQDAEKAHGITHDAKGVLVLPK